MQNEPKTMPLESKAHRPNVDPVRPTRPEPKETCNTVCPTCGHDSREAWHWIKGPVWVVALGLFIFLTSQ